MKKGLPKAQKGLAKLAKVVKTANKTSGNVSKKMQAPPIIRKAKRIANAQQSLSASALGGMTAAELRSKLSSLMEEASAASKAKASTKKLAFKQKGGATSAMVRAVKDFAKKKPGIPKKSATKYGYLLTPKVRKLTKSKMQKGGSIGVKPPDSLKPKGKEKRRLNQNDRRADRMIKKGGDKATINQMREMSKGPLKGTIATKRETKKFVKKYADELSKPVSKAKMQKGGSIKKR